MKSTFVINFIGLSLFTLGVTWGIIELVHMFITKDALIVDEVNYNFFWLIGMGIICLGFNTAKDFFKFFKEI